MYTHSQWISSDEAGKAERVPLSQNALWGADPHRGGDYGATEQEQLIVVF